MTNATSTQLQELYVAYFGRAADPTGLDYWTEKGTSTAAFAANMYAQPEFNSAYGTATTESQVNQIYKNLFDREADVEGLTYWTQEINLGNLQLAEIAVHLIWAAQNNEGSSDDKTALTNRTEAAVAYTAKVKETTSAILAYAPANDGKAEDSEYSAGANITEAINYLATIDKDTAHTDEGVSASVVIITTNETPGVAGKAYTLTTGVDTITAAGGSDTISGSNTTLTAGDNIDGGVGSDSLTVSSAATATFGGFTVSNVETASFSASGGATTADVLNVTGATKIAAVGSSQNVIFSNINDLPTLSVANNSAGNVTFGNLAGDVTGTTDSQTLEITSTTNGTVTVDAIETLDLTVSGTSVITSLAANAATTLNAAGSGDLTLTAIPATVETIDASAYTGKVTWGTIPANDMTITGGTGADTFDFTGGNPTSSDVVDGGDGSDTLRVDIGLTDAATIAKVTNVENIHLIYTGTGVDATVDATLFDGIEIQVADSSAVDNDANIVTVSNAKSTQSITIDNHATAGSNDDIDGTSLTVTQGVGVASLEDALTLTLENEILLDVVTAGYETINIASNVGANTITDLDATSAQNIVITGSKDITLSDVDMEEQTTGTVTRTSTVDASALTGKLTLVMTNDEGDQTITGGSNDDAISMAFSALDADDTITGGGGTDTLTLTDFNGDIGEVQVDVDRLALSSDATSTTGATTIDLRNSTTLTRVTINLDDTVANTTGAVDQNVTVNNIKEGAEVIVQNLFAANTDVLTLDGAAGATALTVTFEDALTDGNGDFNGDFTANYDTLNLKTNDAASDVSIDLFSASTLDTLNLSGAGDLTIASATNTTSLDLIEASSMTGAITLTSIARANGATINLGGGNDSVNWVTTSQAGNIIDGGSGTDTLVITGASTANVVIDLTSTTDQVTNVAGASNTSAQVNFENITATGVTISGVNVTGSADGNTVIGSAQADTITGGTGILLTTPAAGNDVVSLNSTSTDVITLNIESTNGVDTITGFTGGATGDQIEGTATTVAGNGTVADTILTGAAIANLDAHNEITTNAVMINLADDVTRGALATSLNGTSFDLTNMSRIFLVDVGSSVEMLHATNVDTADDNDVVVTHIATFSDIADITASTFHANNFNFI